MDISTYKQQIEKAIGYLEKELQSLQVGRASSGLVENITVHASYGDMKVPQVAHVTILDPQTLKIEPRDKNETKNIEKAIYDAEIGLSPQNEGEYILIKIPPLTEERRINITKKIKIMGEDTKAQIRQTRQDAMKSTKKLLDNKEISEDENKNNENNIEDMVKQFNTKIDELVKNKSDEIMKI
ncbi:MAG TPA: ribosome recycling factor [Candidatus Absconditabacterales bacterium]|nr:ribosome recycling factor [Candidatus Absconditabacterales bacterium]